MTKPPHAAPLPFLAAHAGVEARAPSGPRPRLPDPDAAELIVVANDAEAIFNGLRVAVPLALVFWGALAALIAWLL